METNLNTVFIHVNKVLIHNSIFIAKCFLFNPSSATALKILLHCIVLIRMDVTLKAVHDQFF